MRVSEKINFLSYNVHINSLGWGVVRPRLFSRDNRNVQVGSMKWMSDASLISCLPNGPWTRAACCCMDENPRKEAKGGGRGKYVRRAFSYQ